MKLRDSFLNQEGNFENRLLYSMYTNKSDDNSEQAWGYIDGATNCLESIRPIEELETYINEYEEKNSPLDEYDLSYCLAFKDFIKQEEKKIEGSLEAY